ncbi:MAG TPA: PAS domain S-box protein [Spirochaetota bacterium]|nr:PAS domain S-box protein [Spirochaetota bacterium]
MSNSGNRTLLLVEDEALIAAAEKQRLEAAGYRVSTACNGEDAVALVRRGEVVDLVLMDIDLGSGIDGTGAAQEILTIKDIPIIFLTSHSEKEMVERVRRITRYGYVLKNSGDFVLHSSIEMAFELHDAYSKARENELRWHYALEGAGDGVWDWDVATGEVLFSRQWKGMLGYEDHEIRNAYGEWESLLHPDDRLRSIAALNEYVQGASDVYQNEFRLLCKDGSYKWILDRGKIVERLDDGTPRRIIGTHTDISEHKKTQEALAEKNEALSVMNEELNVAIEEKEATNEELNAAIEELTATNEELLRTRREVELSEEKFSKSFHISAVPMSITTLDEGRFVEVNDAWISLLGFGRDMLIGKNADELGIFVYENNEKDVIEQRKYNYDVKNVEIRLRSESGKINIVLVSTSVITINNKQHRLSSLVDITDRRLAEDALRKNERRLQRAEEIAGFGNWEFRLGENCVRGSQGARLIYGLDGDEWPIPLVQQIPLPQYREMMDNALAELVEKGTPYDITFSVKRKSDNKIIDIHSIAEYDASQKIVFGVIHDITEQKKVQADLRESRERFQQLFDNMADGVAIYRAVENGEDFVFVDINKRGQDISSVEHDNIVGHPVTEVFPGVGEIGLLDVFRRVYLSGTAETLPLVKYEDGRIQEWVENYVFKLPSGLIAALYTDTSIQRKSEEALKAKTAELDTFFNAALDLFCIADTDGYFRRLNMQWEQALGYTMEELEGKRFLDFVHPDDVDATIQTVSELASQKSVLNFTNRYRCRDGTYRFIEWRSFPVGKHIYAAARDITKRMEYEERIQSLLREKDLLMREVHHRIKNNMSTIASLLSLQSGSVQNQRASAALHDAYNRVQSMALIYDRLYRSGNIDTLDVPLYLTELVDDIAGTYTIDPRQIQVEKDISPVAIEVKNGLTLGIILNELVTNALKYAFPEQRKGRVAVVLRVINNEIAELTVMDDGIGLPGDFDVDNPKGFGLLLVSVLVKQIDGTITVTGNSGAEFRIRFPVAAKMKGE